MVAQPAPVRPVWTVPSGIGRIIAFLVLIAAFILIVMGKLDLVTGLMFIGLALAELIP